jgi:O-methyltransferase
MQLLKPVKSRHSLRGRPVTQAVDDDRHLRDGAMPMETGADAEHCGCRAHRHSRGQWAIEGDLEPGSIDWVELPPASAHAPNTTRFHRLAIFLEVSKEVDNDAARSPRLYAAPEASITEEWLRGLYLQEQTRREIRAARPRPGVDATRTAYLELLKLCLCDLAGARTLSVSRTGDTRRPNSQVNSRELDDNELSLRVMGLDWPFSGLTMIGLERLDDLQACVESVVDEGVEGDVIEAGAWRGGASILARATLDSLGADERTVWVADSFRGLPSPDPGAFPEDRHLDLSRVDFLAVPVEEVRGYFARFGCEEGVEFVEGFFDQTLPSLRGRRWSVVRIDGDTYEATWVALESLYPGLSVGGYLIVDDYGLIDECHTAVHDFRREQGILEPIEEIDFNGIRWRRERGPDSSAVSATGKARRRSTPIPTRGRSATRTHIPTERELELERELGELRQRLDALSGSGGEAPR